MPEDSFSELLVVLVSVNLDKHALLLNGRTGRLLADICFGAPAYLSFSLRLDQTRSQDISTLQRFELGEHKDALGSEVLGLTVLDLVGLSFVVTHLG